MRAPVVILLAIALLVAWALAVPALLSPPALILRPAAPPAVSACTRRTAATNAMERWDRAVPAPLSRPVRYPPPPIALSANRQM
jgi:hypothetical protein